MLREVASLWHLWTIRVLEVPILDSNNKKVTMNGNKTTTVNNLKLLTTMTTDLMKVETLW